MHSVLSSIFETFIITYNVFFVRLIRYTPAA